MYILYLENSQEQPAHSAQDGAYVRTPPKCAFSQMTVSCVERSMISKTLQRDLNNLCEWTGLSQLHFNITTCYHLGITNKYRPLFHDYLMNGQAISRATSTKYLGITTNQNLNWNQPCDFNGRLGLLRRVLADCTKDMKSEVYTRFLHPQLKYSSSAWNPYTKQNINHLILKLSNNKGQGCFV